MDGNSCSGLVVVEAHEARSPPGFDMMDSGQFYVILLPNRKRDVIIFALNYHMNNLLI